MVPAAAVSRPFSVACLACGTARVVRRAHGSGLDATACPHCGYVGWRELTVTELDRRLAAQSFAPVRASRRGRMRVLDGRL